jgi:hypothetical protein
MQDSQAKQDELGFMKSSSTASIAVQPVNSLPIPTDTTLALTGVGYTMNTSGLGSGRVAACLSHRDL